MWIATYNKGLYRLDASELNSDSPSFTNFYVDHSRVNSITSNHLRNLYFDKTGVLWISSLGSGINKMTEENTFSFLKADKTNKESIPGNDITGIYLDDDKFIWLGFQEGAFSNYNLKTEKVDNYKLKNENNEIHCLIRLNKDEILLGVYEGGLHLFNERSKTETNVVKHYSAADSLQEKSFECFKRLNDSIILCGMSSMTGLIEFNTNTKKFTQIGDHKFVNDIVLDSDDNIWIFSSWTDINVLDRSYKTIKSIPRIRDYNVFYSGARDIRGNTWLASKFGLRIIDSTSVIKTFGYDESLRDGESRGVIKGANNFMWVFGVSGITKVDPIKRTVIRLDGSGGVVFKKAVKLNNGKIYLASNGGLVSFHPDSLMVNGLVPEVAITRFDIFNKEIHVNDTVYGRQVLSKDISYTDQIELTHKSNVLSFEFSCLDFSATYKNQYEYMLEGIDKDWVHQDRNRNFASYAGLPHGKYIFRVRAANNIGIWNEKGVSLAIEILPPWWATMWFKIVIFIFLIITIWLIVYYKERNLKQANLRLEKTVASKTNELLAKNHQLKEILKAKDLFFSILAHDLRNPFGTIEQLLGVLYDDYKDYSDKERKELLGDLKQLAGNTYIILENLLIWGRRKNNQLTKPKLIELDLKNQISMVINQFIRHPKNIRIEFDEMKDYLVIADFNLIDFVLRNLIQNAFKFSQQNSRIEIKTRLGNDKIWIVIKDFGIGMDNNQVNDLLWSSKIESKSGTMGEKGTGLGIVNCREFIRMMSGEFKIESKLGEGSSFMFSLPLVLPK
jgi:signal transduction histidine kinase